MVLDGITARSAEVWSSMTIFFLAAISAFSQIGLGRGPFIETFS